MRVVRFLGVIGMLLALAVGAGTLPDTSPDMKGILPAHAIVPDGEELVYEVSWSFLKIGSIRIVTHSDLSADAYIDSYDGLPFVDLHSVHSTRMDSSFTPLSSRSVEWKEDRWWGYDYTADHNGRLFVDEIIQKDLKTAPTVLRRVDTIEVGQREYVDGLSIAFYPRRFVHARRSVDVPTVLYGKLGMTQFNFEDDIVREDVDAVDRRVRCVEVHGSTSVVGVFGMTGEFNGWFSDDSAAIPLKGTLKVLLGSVDVQLIRWNRPGWTPPE